FQFARFAQSAHSLDNFTRSPDCMRMKIVIDQRGLISISPDRVTRAGGRVLDYSNLKALFQKFPEMRFHAHVCEHAAEDYFLYAPLAQLEHKVVCLWPEDFVGADDNCLSVLDIGFEAVEPVSA